MDSALGFPYCSSMRLLHVCQRASVQEPPLTPYLKNCETGSRISTLAFPPTPVLGLAGLGAAMLNHAVNFYLGGGGGVKDSRTPPSGTSLRLIMDMMLHHWHVKYWTPIGRQMCVNMRSSSPETPRCDSELSVTPRIYNLWRSCCRDGGPEEVT
ncbi:hypothetical protein PBY51_015553 [Eleginops maclovinus]|uniref:Uncharacterized protein n=1 Tax=Eleginops maclovinus TaxID=56733 RepID=A0AAN7XHD6_ELEMC|nr:hypothetical protein PBY51_015553 [Eleginops maclovinus]